MYASSVARFYESYRDIGIKAEIPGCNDLKADTLRLVRNWLSDERNGNWLLILDNADDINVLSSNESDNSTSPRQTMPLVSYIPQSPHGSVLVTTRYRKAAHTVVGDYDRLLEVNAMSESDAIQLLQSRLDITEANTTHANKLVKLLQFIPLAITQAAAYIREKAPRMTVLCYIEEFSKTEANKMSLLDKSAADLRRDPEVPNAIITTWTISLCQLLEQHPSSANLLSLMSVLANDSIPEYLVCGDDERLEFEDTLTPLVGFALVTLLSDGSAFCIHPLVQLATRKWLGNTGEITKWKREAVQRVSETFPGGNYENWIRCKELLPQAEIVLSYELEDRRSLLQQADILYLTAWYMATSGNYISASRRSQKAFELRESLLAEDDLNLVNSIHMLALVLRAQGKYEAAEEMNRRALESSEKVLGAEHPDTLMSLSNLASVLAEQGKYEAAEEMNRRVLESREKVLGAEHPDTLMSLLYLAWVLAKQGKHEAAEKVNRELANREAIKEAEQ